MKLNNNLTGWRHRLICKIKNPKEERIFSFRLLPTQQKQQNARVCVCVITLIREEEEETLCASQSLYKASVSDSIWPSSSSLSAPSIWLNFTMHFAKVAQSLNWQGRRRRHHHHHQPYPTTTAAIATWGSSITQVLYHFYTPLNPHHMARGVTLAASVQHDRVERIFRFS